MKPFEIAQKYVYGEHDALTDNQEIIDMTKDIEQAIAEQLILSGVIQQRELLNALADEFNDSTHTYVGQPLIEKILKAFNCG